MYSSVPMNVVAWLASLTRLLMPKSASLIHQVCGPSSVAGCLIRIF